MDQYQLKQYLLKTRSLNKYIQISFSRRFPSMIEDEGLYPEIYTMFNPDHCKGTIWWTVVWREIVNDRYIGTRSKWRNFDPWSWHFTPVVIMEGDPDTFTPLHIFRNQFTDDVSFMYIYTNSLRLKNDFFFRNYVSRIQVTFDSLTSSTTNWFQESVTILDY